MAQPDATEAWACEACTFENGPSVSSCDMCGTSRPVQQKRPKSGTEESEWVCSTCTYSNKPSITSCEMCSTARVSDSPCPASEAEASDNNTFETSSPDLLSSMVTGDEQSQFDIILACVDPPEDIVALDGEFPNEAVTITSLKTFKEFPCTLVQEQEGSAKSVSREAYDMMKRMSQVLGPVGTRQGFYGAGGGAIHLLYCGKVDGDLPGLDSIVADLLHIKPSFHPPFAWMSTVDPCHQQMFPRTAREVDENGDDFLKLVYTALDQANVRTLPYELPATCQQEFPYISKARILFVEPLYDMFHDGGCPQGCPRNDEVLVESIGGDPGCAGDIPNSPAFAMFQLISGEVMAFCNWDYRD
jgi:hypothetical protein